MLRRWSVNIFVCVIDPFFINVAAFTVVINFILDYQSPYRTFVPWRGLPRSALMRLSNIKLHPLLAGVQLGCQFSLALPVLSILLPIFSVFFYYLEMLLPCGAHMAEMLLNWGRLHFWLQCFGHLMQTADSLKKTLMLGKIEGRRRRWLDGHEFEQAPGDVEGQESLACCSPWGRKASDMTEQLNGNKCIL